MAFGTAQAQFAQRPERELPPGGIRSAQHDFRIVTVAEGLVNPWSMAWLPNGDLLVTEKAGSIRTIRNGTVSAPMANVPAVNSTGQGGLFDIVLHPDYDENGWVYISFAKPLNDQGVAATTVIRARIRDNALVDIEEIYEANAKVQSAGHYGARIAFDEDNYMFVASGERMAPTTGDLTQHPAQQTDNHSGAIVRLHDDGSVPDDNPFVGRAGYDPAVWSYGHRNPQGLVYDAETGNLWSTEHGPQGGDELNLIQPGLNYGWPVIGYGANYGSGTEIHTEGREKEGMQQPVAFWVPSIAPSGLMIYTGDQFPQWRGNLFAGGLSADHGRLSRITVNGTTVSGREPLLMKQYRIRDVRQGPDGFIYVATDHRFGQPTAIIRLEPIE
ncbi:MAG: PQQ-dependent sugar dehydrogenase [Gammaproteobacteria bacterium]|nr:PQQ-dependent sugar dehydrogenase [Gammaproteobacteria bacterium]